MTPPSPKHIQGMPCASILSCWCPLWVHIPERASVPSPGGNSWVPEKNCSYPLVMLLSRYYTIDVRSYPFISIDIHSYPLISIDILPAGLEMGRVKTAFSCDWQEFNHAFRSVSSCFYVVHEGQFYCDFEFSLGFTVYSWHVGVRKRFLLGSQRAQNLSCSHFFRWSLHLR